MSVFTRRSDSNRRGVYSVEDRVASDRVEGTQWETGTIMFVWLGWGLVSYSPSAFGTYHWISPSFCSHLTTDRILFSVSRFTGSLHLLWNSEWLLYNSFGSPTIGVTILLFHKGEDQSLDIQAPSYELRLFSYIPFLLLPHLKIKIMSGTQNEY